MHQVLLCIFCVLDILNTFTPLIKSLKWAHLLYYIYTNKQKIKNDKSPSVKNYISAFVYIPSICKKRMYALYNTARCVNTAEYINLGSHWLTNHIHMFPMSHTLSKSVHISQRHSTAHLTDILRISTYSIHDQPLETSSLSPTGVNSLWPWVVLPVCVHGCAEHMCVVNDWICL
jgi:hypothetical protein